MTIIDAIDNTARTLKTLSKVLTAIDEQVKGMSAPQAASVEVKEIPK